MRIRATMRIVGVTAMLFLATVEALAVPVAGAPTTDGDALTGFPAKRAGDSCADICEATRDVLQKYVDAKAVAGAISLVSVSGRVEVAYVGLADPKTERAMDAKSFFWIASMTKGFCGAAVMACVDRGLLRLDDPVEKYIPCMRDVRVRMKNADGLEKRVPTSKKMTIRMCLSHVAGYDFYTQATLKYGSDGLSLADQALAASQEPLLHDVETKHRYANPAGGLYSTAGDVMKFYMMLANDGKAPDGRRILSHEAIVQLATAQYPALDRYTLGLRQFGDWFGHDGALQTEGYANWKQDRAALLFIQVVGPWDHPFKAAWRKVALSGAEKGNP